MKAIVHKFIIMIATKTFLLMKWKRSKVRLRKKDRESMYHYKSCTPLCFKNK